MTRFFYSGGNDVECCLFFVSLKGGYKNAENLQNSLTAVSTTTTTVIKTRDYQRYNQRKKGTKNKLNVKPKRKPETTISLLKFAKEAHDESSHDSTMSLMIKWIFFVLLLIDYRNSGQGGNLFMNQ